MIKGFIYGFTIGYLMAGLFIKTIETSKHNMELYAMEVQDD
jgi:hypothetical protein